MTEPPGPNEDLTPAERAVRDHLAVLRDDPPMSAAVLVTKVVRTARWQNALRRPLFVIDSLTHALREGLGLLFGSEPRR